MRKRSPSKPRRKSAREKLDRADPNYNVPFRIPADMKSSLAGGTMIVPRPTDVEALMQTPRKGKLVTLNQIRAALARRAGADHCCPLTTGIFARLSAEAAEESAAAGARKMTPWWRTIRDNGKLIDKFPGGGAEQAKRLRAEGFKLEPGRGKQPPRVLDFESYVIKLS